VCALVCARACDCACVGLTVLVLFVCCLVYLLCTHFYTVNCYYVSNCETVGSVVVVMSSARLHVFLNAVACHYICKALCEPEGAI
jgi:hypothetical protein